MSANQCLYGQWGAMKIISSDRPSARNLASVGEIRAMGGNAYSRI